MSKHKFKIGDRVRCIDPYYTWLKERETQVFTVSKYSDDNDGIIYVKDEHGEEAGGYRETRFELINPLTPDNMSLTKKFAQIFKSEPQRSFNKAGVTDSGDVLTEEGTTVFLSWLLQKYGDDFKKEVVDPILKEAEKKE